MRTGPGQMPVFGPDTFSDHQVNSIVRYVRYLSDPDDPGGFSLGRIGPITEGLVALLHRDPAPCCSSAVASRSRMSANAERRGHAPDRGRARR